MYTDMQRHGQMVCHKQDGVIISRDNLHSDPSNSRFEGQRDVENEKPASETTLVRSECILGLRAFLHKRRVPGFDNPACDCGGGRQTAKHTIMFCTKWDRATLFTAGSQDYRKMVSTARGIRAITRWMISCGILEQFNLYR